jgi:two-component system, NarL family, sensor histidine kinase EvgS
MFARKILTSLNLLFRRETHPALPKFSTVTLICILLCIHNAQAATVLLLTDPVPRPVSLSPAEKAFLASRPALRVAIKPEWAPIDTMSVGGVYGGISGDYLRLLASRLSVRLEVTQYASNTEAINALKSGRADIIPSLAETRERLQIMRFTRPYLDVPNAVFARVDAPLFAVDGNWAGLRVAAERGFAVINALSQNKPEARLIEFADSEAAVNAVAQGQADVYVGALPTTAAIVEKLLLRNVEVRGYIDSPFQLLRFGVRRDAPELASVLERAMNSVSAAEADAIRERWTPMRNTLQYTQGALPLSPAQRDWITKNNRLRVAFDPEMNPISFVDSNGNMTGVAVDYLRIVTKKLGMSIVEERRGNWSEILQMAKRGEVDVLIAAAMNQERLDYLDFAGPYLTAPTVLVDANRGFAASDISLFVGKRLAVLKDHFLVGEVERRYPGITIMPFDKLESALDAVVTGKVDGAMGNLHPVAQLIGTRFIGKLRISGNVLRGDSALYFASPRDKPELGQLLTLAKASISQDERNSIRDRWLSVTYKPGFSWRSILTVAVPILTALLAALLVFIWLNARLRRAVRHRNQVVLELASKRLEAEAAVQAKARFLAAMSHEIRTPMQGILGASELLARSALEPAQSRLNGIVRDASQNLVQLLNEILDRHKLDEGNVTAYLEQTDVVEKVQSAVNVFAPSAVNKSLKLEVLISPGVAEYYRTDGTFIRQIVSNLVSNALKFTREGGVTVSLDAEVVSGDNTAHTLVLRVRDTGNGMSAAERAELFKPYVQGESGRQSGTGSGLGLSICAKLSEALGGSITADSVVGQGSVFTLRFPAAVILRKLDDTHLNLRTIQPATQSEELAASIVQTATAEKAAPSAQTDDRIKALVCEDDMLIRELLAEQFSELGVAAEIVADASIGLSRLKEKQAAGQHYDIIFTDNSMGGMSGIEFTRHVRKLERKHASRVTPIVGITGSIMLGEQQKCLEAGMNRVLCKPVVLADLKKAMDDFVAT